ncbi:unnamed protein product [Rotaria sp. Silwood2]|nr:unnamed protein product [Rotaria sp. Silwood2]CAF2986164.1 unnamed protein product [Rotaria sp. Silwood2]CAF3275112.1 unnamed protein product [Rotaria sp. Silwood2]CAF3383010.1 unnamed protein product [Rotaria sp. Silwood2]CAF4169162.1 unnamed protein product [Rotaria sp. Silwood2]
MENLIIPVDRARRVILGTLIGTIWNKQCEDLDNSYDYSVLFKFILPRLYHSLFFYTAEFLSSQRENGLK